MPPAPMVPAMAEYSIIEMTFSVMAATIRVRTEIAGYKVPRSLWLVDEVKRSPAGKPDYRWAKDTTEQRAADDVHAKHAGAKA